VNNKGKEFVKVIKVVSHQGKKDKKENNHSYYASKIHANDSHVPYMSYHDFDASNVIVKNKNGRVIARYVGHTTRG
jgi:hypothetical protein